MQSKWDYRDVLCFAKFIIIEDIYLAIKEKQFTGSIITNMKISKQPYFDLNANHLTLYEDCQFTIN